MKLKSQKDFLSGVMFSCVGVAFAIDATNYNVGTGARNGPGYFPLVFGILLGGLTTLGVPAMGLMVTIYALVLLLTIVLLPAVRAKHEEALVEV